MIDHVGKSQQENYPGLTVSRDGDAIVVRIPVRFHRRNGRQMVLTHGGSNGHAAPERELYSDNYFSWSATIRIPGCGCRWGTAERQLEFPGYRR
jgi:hypothetical protein